VVEAVLQCQREGVFHRDIKDSNILVDLKTLTVKLNDFGLGVYVKDGNTFFDVSCGTIAYSPPEIIMHQKYQGSPAAVWSLGVLLYEMVCGIRPFEKHYQILSTVVSFPSNISRPCRELISSLIQYRPVKRPGLEHILLHPWLQQEVEVKAIPARKRMHLSKYYEWRKNH